MNSGLKAREFLRSWAEFRTRPLRAAFPNGGGMKKHFLTGLVILLSLAVTLAVVGFIVNFLTKPFIGFVSALLTRLDIINRGIFFLSPDQTLRYGSQLLILVILFFATLILGMVTEWFFIKALFRLGDTILHKIPLVNTVYKTTQDIIKTLFVSDKKSFKQVVMAPFPKEGSYVLGLIARESPQACSQSAGVSLLSVLVPTTPNPTTGFLLMCTKEDLIFLDMKTEDAVKYIVSCGVIVPEETPLLPPPSSAP